MGSKISRASESEDHPASNLSDKKSLKKGITETDIEKDAESYHCWATSSDGFAFWGSGTVINTLPPDFYQATYDNNIGYLLRKIILSTDDIIPLPNAETELVVKEIEQFWQMKPEFTKRGFLHKRGILMWGEPGSGKTSAIQRLISSVIERGGIAVYADKPYTLSACLQMIRRIEPELPIVVVLEDFENLTYHNESVSEWLSVLDGESRVDNVVYLATTNYIERIDKRFKDRPSRFDVVLPIPMPNDESRRLFLKTKEPSLTEPELDNWVSKTKGMSIAHLKELIISVKCYGKPLDVAVKRLRDMQRRNDDNDDLRHNPDNPDGQKLGFV